MVKQRMLTSVRCSLGLPIPEGAIEQMKARLEVTDDDLKVAAEEEKIRRHDVMGSSCQLFQEVWNMF